MVKVVRNFILIFLSFIVLMPCAYAVEVCEMSEDYKRWRALSDEERANFIEPPYCASSIKDQYSAKIILEKNSYGEFNINEREDLELRASVSQSRYNAVDDGIVTSVKNQKSTNTCWAFTSNSLLETAALKEGLGNYDLSERHIEYSVTRTGFTDNYIKTNGFNRNVDAGGNAYMSSSYYFRHEGPIYESSMPFVESVSKISISSLPQTKAILDVDTFSYEAFSSNTGCSSQQISAIKNRVVTYGSAGASMYYNDSYLKGGKYFYYPYSSTSNHAVTIVGWDDSISTDNFNNSPATNGAWIVKNSWGTSFGESGYLYISYSDTRICNSSYNYSGVSVNKYDYAYAASDFLSSYNVSFGSAMNYSSAKFTKKYSGPETLDKVSIEVIQGNGYAVYLSKSNNLYNQSDWQLLGSGTASYDGVISVRFTPVTITSDFTIIVKRTGSDLYLPLMCKSVDSASKYYYATINSGVNYYSNTGSSWTDYSTAKLKNASGNILTNGCSPVIYAYTKASSTGSATFDISSITGNNTTVYGGTGDYYTAYITSSGISSFNTFGIKVLNSSGTDVTSKFTITNSLSNGNVRVTPSDIAAGTYTLRLEYGTIVRTKTFVVSKLYTSSNCTLKNGYIIANPGTLKAFTKADFAGKINFGSKSYKIYNSSGVEVTSNTGNVGTGYKLIIEGRTLYIVLLGDTTGDGKIKTLDALYIGRSLVNTMKLTDAQLLAADTTGDGKIKTLDALYIGRFLVGLKGSL